jgi:hypothetical protein
MSKNKKFKKPENTQEEKHYQKEQLPKESEIKKNKKQEKKFFIDDRTLFKSFLIFLASIIIITLISYFIKPAATIKFINSFVRFIV